MISQVVLFAALAALSAASMMPQPYKFGYDIKDKHGEQYRKEEGNGGYAVKGSYGFTDDRGVKREVDYVADKAGFRAQVKTNEPGTANQNPAAVAMISEAPYAGGVGLGYGLGGIGGYGNLGYGVAEGYGLGGYEGYKKVGYGIVSPVYGYNDGLKKEYNLGYGGYGLGYGLEGLGYARYGY